MSPTSWLAELQMGKANAHVSEKIPPKLEIEVYHINQL